VSTAVCVNQNSLVFVIGSLATQRLNALFIGTRRLQRLEGMDRQPTESVCSGSPIGVFSGVRLINPPPHVTGQRLYALSRAKVNDCTHSTSKKPLTCGNTVPEVGLEPTHLSIPHFECGASANSATRARNTQSKPVRPQLIVSNAIASRTRNYSTAR
jgi:hypothetical protein